MAEYDSDFYPIYLPWSRTPEATQLRELLESGLNDRWSTHRNKSTETVIYSGPMNEHMPERESIDTEIDDLVGAESGSIKSFDDVTDFLLEVSS